VVVNLLQAAKVIARIGTSGSRLDKPMRGWQYYQPRIIKEEKRCAIYALHHASFLKQFASPHLQTSLKH
jgi:hypothetical protein